MSFLGTLITLIQRLVIFHMIFNFYTCGSASNTKAMTAASPYCLYADAFILILSASARPTASIARASAAPVKRTRSASARAASTVCVLVK